VTDVAPDQMLGRTLLDRYVIESKLGEGGMGAVYLARHLVLEKRVALKVLHAELQRKPDLVERFLNEAKSASRIRHENVIDITDFGTAPDGTVFFAMELLEGRDLHDVMTHAALDGQRLPWSRTRNIFLQVCAALTAAHKAGILHRDLKPENIYLVEWLGHPDFVKLLDFGIAKSTEVLEEGRKLTRTGMLFGTPEYMAPEQARGEKVDARVDVYAMGCILYQLISGRVPFEGDSFMAVLSKHLSEEAASIEAEAAEVGAPAGVTEVITKALSKDRDERYDTIDELAMAVRMADRRAGRHSVAPPFHTTAESPVVQVPAAAAARGKNRAALSIALAGIVAAAAAVGAVLVMKNRGDDPTTPGAIAIDAGATAKTPAPQPDPAPEAKGREPEPVAPAIDAGVAGAAHAKVPHARPTPVPTPTPTVTPTVTPAVTPKQPTSPTPDEEEPEIGNVKPKDPFGSGQGTPP
jgi:serine/threonine-protein kinase